MKNRLLLIDISNFIYRAHYGIMPLFYNGLQTNAIYGVGFMVLNLIEELRPSHVIIAVDSNEPKERKELFAEYKGTRKETPAELKTQIPLIMEMLELLNFKSIEVSKQEADDVIGTIATLEKGSFKDIIIASSDKDLMQLVDDNIFMYDSMKKITYDKGQVFNKMGVYPNQIIDLLALLGDKSDNIPGVAGIGSKTAINLLERYFNLVGIYASIEELSSKSVKQKLLYNKANAELSYVLATVNRKIDIQYDIDECRLNLNKNKELLEFLISLNLNDLKNKVNRMYI